MSETRSLMDLGCPEDFPLAVFPGIPSTAGVPIHQHTFTEILLILTGQGTHIIGDDEYPILAGDVFVIHGDVAHGIKDSVEMQLTNVMFEPERLPIPHEALWQLPGFRALFALEPYSRRQHHFRGRLHLSIKELFIAAMLVERMQAEEMLHGPGYRMVMTAQLVELLVYLSRCYAFTTNPRSRVLLQVSESLTVIERDYADPLTLEALAARAHMSVPTFLRAFRESTGMSPIGYLLQYRIRQAKDLLLSTQHSITEIALRTGFMDSNYFARQFKKSVGVTPREFREDSGGASGG